MKLYLAHCGYYDLEVCEGIYESHANFFVAAQSMIEAKESVKKIPEFQNKRMHIDGLQEIVSVGGYELVLLEDKKQESRTTIVNYKHRDLANPSKSN